MIPTTQSKARQERLPRILLWSLLGIVLVGVVGIGVWSLAWDEPTKRLSSALSPAHLPVYGAVPDFALIDQSGHPVGRGDLAGKVWIASFLFTNCPDECPLLTSEMARLQADLAHIADFRLVSISVDPDRDTPAVLSQYAERFNADPGRWLFLTGDKRAIYRLAREGFRLGIVDPAESSHSTAVKGNTPGGARSSLDRQMPSGVEQTSGWRQNLRGWLRFVEPVTAFADHGRVKDTSHSTRLVLIDRLSQIRGYYESREESALQRLRQHLQMLFRDG
jgi:cytochrome oxidase Cu insertion factor (SCO1/SenC/PrrC family)